MEELQKGKIEYENYTHKKIEKCVKQPRNGKVPGAGGVPNELIKNDSSELIQMIFLDTVKTSDNLPVNKLWEALEDSNIKKNTDKNIVKAKYNKN